MNLYPQLRVFVEHAYPRWYHFAMVTKSIITPDSPIHYLKGVSTKIEKPLSHLGINTIQDLLLHLPFRYDDFSHIKNIADIQFNETATIQGKILSVHESRSWKKRMHILNITISDATGSINAIWYNQPFLARSLVVGKIVSLSGKISHDGVLQNPAHEMMTTLGKKTTHTGRLVPIYNETSGITSRWMRYLLHNALPFIDLLPETLPRSILDKENLPSLSDAIRDIHFPNSLEQADRAKKRFAFEELFLLQLLILQSRASLKNVHTSKIRFDLAFVKQFVASLPFSLTHSQRRAAWEIIQDMERQTPMNRLLEGDVGSGKTIVAAIVSFNAAMQGFQSAFMAPTEILASQHFETFTAYAKNFPINVCLLTGNIARVYDAQLETSYVLSRTELEKKISNGSLHIIIGTHALISGSFIFPNLGLVILDEQHRFGVAQRASLLEKKKSSKIPHFLSMTATPIPRTLTLALYGDLDISLLKEMPKNRKKIITRIVKPSQRNKEYVFIESQIKLGRQVFFICPRIEISNKTSERSIAQAEIKSVKEEFTKLSEKIFPHVRIAMLHGKIKPKEKESTMNAFSQGKIDILVSTSVVEVGVDIPNASVMAIEGSERFGLAQLHQFRGRVGRAEHQSYCLLFTDSDSENENKRLKAMITSHDGFKLAEYDLQLRGPGDLLGNRQSGLPDLTMASLTDVELIKTARDAAERILHQDPLLGAFPKLKKHLSRFHSQIHFE